MRARAIIFDLDGTLADTLVDIAAAANHVLAERGLATHSVGDYRLWVGEGARQLVERALVASGAPASDTDETLERFRAHYGANLIVDTRPYPGIPALLDELSELSLPMAVLSNKPHEMTCRIVAELFASWRFEPCFGHRVEVARKPDPTAALEIARHLGLPPERCAFVGDTGVDIDTAHAAGMVPVAVDWGFRRRDELLPYRPRAILAHPSELTAWLRS